MSRYLITGVALIEKVGTIPDFMEPTERWKYKGPEGGSGSAMSEARQSASFGVSKDGKPRIGSGVKTAEASLRRMSVR